MMLSGLRYSSAVSDVEYALTVQRGRQSMPYFSYDVIPIRLLPVIPSPGW